MGRVALVGELTATIAHELRQPLAAIRANAEVGVKLATRSAGDLGGEQWEFCRDIFADIVRDDEHAADIVTRVRALLRREELPRAPVDVNEICRAAVRFLQNDAQGRHVHISLSPDTRSPTTTGDAVQLQQVVLNLALNALDASMSSAHPQVVVRTVARGEDVEIVVEDNGAGFPPHVEQRLFQSFFTTKPQGLGLGLVIVQSIVERHQGHVRAENREQGGARFRVVLPSSRHARLDSRDTPRDPVEPESPVSASAPAA
jgi:signal transduction histidine kinase